VFITGESNVPVVPTFYYTKPIVASSTPSNSQLPQDPAAGASRYSRRRRGLKVEGVEGEDTPETGAVAYSDSLSSKTVPNTSDGVKVVKKGGTAGIKARSKVGVVGLRINVKTRFKSKSPWCRTRRRHTRRRVAVDMDTVGTAVTEVSADSTELDNNTVGPEHLVDGHEVDEEVAFVRVHHPQQHHGSMSPRTRSSMSCSPIPSLSTTVISTQSTVSFEPSCQLSDTSSAPVARSNDVCHLEVWCILFILFISSFSSQSIPITKNKLVKNNTKYAGHVRYFMPMISGFPGYPGVPKTSEFPGRNRVPVFLEFF